MQSKFQGIPKNGDIHEQKFYDCQAGLALGAKEKGSFGPLKV